MPSSTDLYKWFLDSLHQPGLCRTPNSNLQIDLSTATQNKPRPPSPERTQTLSVLHEPLRLPPPKQAAKSEELPARSSAITVHYKSPGLALHLPRHRAAPIH